jgi:hypothetical protein
MLGALAISGYILPPPTLTAERGSHRGVPSGDLLARLAEFAETQARARSKLRDQRDRFEQLYRQAEQPEVNPDDLEALAHALRAQEEESAAVLVPQIEQLKIDLVSPKDRADTPAIRSWRRLAEESVEIAVVWLELYQNLQIRLFRLASDRRSETEPSSPIFDNAEDAAEYLRKLVAE